jgi:hypothetical protein
MATDISNANPASRAIAEALITLEGHRAMDPKCDELARRLEALAPRYAGDTQTDALAGRTGGREQGRDAGGAALPAVAHAAEQGRHTGTASLSARDEPGRCRSVGGQPRGLIASHKAADAPGIGPG